MDPHPFPSPLRRPDWARAIPGLYLGPERRQRGLTLSRLMSQVLDEIDYGLLLVGEGRQVIHANHAARVALNAGHPLQLLGQELRARDSQDVAPLHDAVQGAIDRQLRRLLVLGARSAQRTEVSVVPLRGRSNDPDPAWALLVMGRRQVCGPLSVHGYARAHGLSPGEESVLRCLCEGLSPGQIALHNGVKIATVRTQIASIRAKTGADSIRDLVQQVALLPPLMGALRDELPWHAGLIPSA